MLTLKPQGSFPVACKTLDRRTQWIDLAKLIAFPNPTEKENVWWGTTGRIGEMQELLVLVDGNKWLLLHIDFSVIPDGWKAESGPHKDVPQNRQLNECQVGMWFEQNHRTPVGTVAAKALPWTRLKTSKGFGITYDRRYGIDKRTGWSITIDGRVVANIEPWLIVACWKAFKDWITGA